VEIVKISTQKARDQIEAFEKYQASLYPAESNHPVSLEILSTQNTIFYGVLENENILAIGALEVFKNYGEIKRVFVIEAHRGKGLAKRIMAALENFLFEQSIKSVKLKIGILQYEALGLYRKLGYKECHAFGTHRPDSDSVFMTKSFK